jgi:hypothetical protein
MGVTVADVSCRPSLAALGLLTGQPFLFARGFESYPSHGFTFFACWKGWIGRRPFRLPVCLLYGSFLLSSLSTSKPLFLSRENSHCKLSMWSRHSKYRMDISLFFTHPGKVRSKQNMGVFCLNGLQTNMAGSLGTCCQVSSSFLCAGVRVHVESSLLSCWVSGTLWGHRPFGQTHACNCVFRYRQHGICIR